MVRSPVLLIALGDDDSRAAASNAFPAARALAATSSQRSVSAFRSGDWRLGTGDWGLETGDLRTARGSEAVARTNGEFTSARGSRLGSCRTSRAVIGPLGAGVLRSGTGVPPRGG